MQGGAKPPKLDARLEAVADFVRPGSVVADIGCDHGQLTAHLTASGKCPLAYACDVNEKPLDKARELVESMGIRERVRLLRTDGLAGLPLEQIDDVVIAGMGGELIARIILDARCARDERLRFVLQPMTKAQVLRRALYRGGFALIDERGVGAGDFEYTVMAARYTGEKREIDDLFAWTGLLPQNDHPHTAAMLRVVWQKLRRKAEGLRSGGHPEATRWAALADRVLDIIQKRSDHDAGLQGGRLCKGD